ncbi:DMT family transporter [Streptococcus anginosus]|uniref:EamA-like transporter family protein n=1 Tax=Streptococcus anginosus SK1138 TaxID=1161422 RepID=A0AAD2TA61_STRAP|nr:DMT family transporter [Streptococcus anginosus]EJP27361.1 EamA-like transporter family protein [Streptococcus anginosus SK1138]MCY7224063.1 DMT family transporter [Streptococcus anginosus]RIB36382.1 EamA family transporter [Streptococcus anginosus]
MSKIAKGTILTLVAGIAWGLSGTSGQYLMTHGFPVLVLTNIRLLIAGLLLVLYMLLTNRRKLVEMLKDQKAMMSLTLFALLGLLLNQFAYLKSIYESNAGTATVLQYVCPVGILAYTCLKDCVAPTVTEVLSMILAVGGTFLIATHGQFNQLSVTPTGLFWGLFAAFTYALYILIPIQLIKMWGSISVIGVGMMLAGIVLTPFSGVLRFHWQLSMKVYLALVGIILVGTIIAYTLFLKGTSLVGPVKSSLLAAVEPISAVFFAFLIMHEQFYFLDFVGMFMILSAVALISIKDLILEKRKGIL